MTSATEHRLDGLEPDNLLAFLALLGLLRALEAARPEWRPRVGWTVDEPPVRPLLRLRAATTNETVVDAAAAGLRGFVNHHDLNNARDLSFTVSEAREHLERAVRTSRPYADLWASLISDAAVSSKGDKVEPTPLCLMFGQGHQHFLERLAKAPGLLTPPARGEGRRKTTISESECLREALFVAWTRPDATPSFRWDPHEDVRYALRANDPTDTRTKETTQHGANRLASVGLGSLTVAPVMRGGATRLGIIGGRRDAGGGFAFVWPIWRIPVTLAAIVAFLDHPRLDDELARASLGIAERRMAKRISAGKFMNFTRAEII
jgi:hypothetical protein